MSKPFSQACENNKTYIGDVLQEYFSEPGSVLEIGSGSGQHAVYLAERFPHLHWMPSDVAENISGISLWCEEYPGTNLAKPMVLNVRDCTEAPASVDYVFSANTAHIMSWPEVQMCFALIARCLQSGGRFCLYGPFNYEQQYTSESNKNFDQWLKSRDPQSGIRDFEAIVALANSEAMQLLADVAMPANNRCLVFAKS